MLFNSFAFIFVFLPMSILGWFGLNYIRQYKAAQIFLVAMSLWFYGFYNPSYVWLILGSCLFNYLASFFLRLVQSADLPCDTPSGLKKKHIILKIIGILGITGNLGLLFYYKYMNFFLENINYLLDKEYTLLNVILPMGISFFTFQQVAFLADRMSGKTAHCSLIDYCSFVIFFPQLLSGPIVMYDELLPQFADKEKRRFNPDNFTQGCVRVILGLGKKVLLADTLSLVTNGIYNARYYFTTWSAIVFILTYAFVLYFDFSGYCDIALGVAKMLNITLPENFESPYRSRSMKEFWNRWHITLSHFFIRYVYIPLGGSRKGKKRQMANIMVVFLLSGLWHGAGLNYALWGFLNGFGVILCSLVKPSQTWENSPVKRFFSWLFTFSYFLFTLIFFRCESLQDILIVFRGLSDPVGIKLIYDMGVLMEIPELYVFAQAIDMFSPSFTGMVYCIAYALVMLLCVILLNKKNTQELIREGKYTTKTAVFLAIIFVWSVISFSGVSSFVYFNY